MKLQDILFFVLFAFLLFKQNPKYAAGAGIVSLVIAIPLFAAWIFFTAERLTWYAAAFFLLTVLLSFFNVLKQKKI